MERAPVADDDVRCDTMAHTLHAGVMSELSSKTTDSTITTTNAKRKRASDPKNTTCKYKTYYQTKKVREAEKAEKMKKEAMRERMLAQDFPEVVSDLNDLVARATKPVQRIVDIVTEEIQSEFKSNLATAQEKYTILCDQLIDTNSELKGEQKKRQELERSNAAQEVEIASLKIQLSDCAKNETLLTTEHARDIAAAQEQLKVKTEMTQTMQRTIETLQCKHEILQTMTLAKLEQIRSDCYKRMMAVEAVMTEQREVRQSCQICKTSTFDQESETLRAINPCGHMLCTECAPRIQKCGVCKCDVKGLISIRDFL